jgi:cellobiose phosphorylase
MILNGVIGLRLGEHALSFAPYLPAGITHIQLIDLTWRNAVLNISIKGSGRTIKTFSVDGRPQKAHSIASTMSGKHSIAIELAGDNL